MRMIVSFIEQDDQFHLNKEVKYHHNGNDEMKIQGNNETLNIFTNTMTENMDRPQV